MPAPILSMRDTFPTDDPVTSWRDQPGSSFLARAAILFLNYISINNKMSESQRERRTADQLERRLHYQALLKIDWQPSNYCNNVDPSSKLTTTNTTTKWKAQNMYEEQENKCQLVHLQDIGARWMSSSPNVSEAEGEFGFRGSISSLVGRRGSVPSIPRRATPKHKDRNIDNVTTNKTPSPL